MRVFFDTSAFAKRYVEENGTQQILQLCAEAEAVGLSIICLPEMISTLCRLVREKQLSAIRYRRIKQAMLVDMADIDICQITPQILHQVVLLLEHHPLRAMDAIHLGCAVSYQAELFVSADRRQIDAAHKAGLHVLDLTAT